MMPNTEVCVRVCVCVGTVVYLVPAERVSGQCQVAVRARSLRLPLQLIIDPIGSPPGPPAGPLAAPQGATGRVGGAGHAEVGTRVLLVVHLLSSRWRQRQ